MTFARVVEVVVALGWILALAWKIAAQRRRGIQALAVGRADEGVARWLDPVLLAGLAAWLALLAAHGFLLPVGPCVWTPSPVLVGIGATLELLGFALVLLALAHMGRAWRIGIDRRTSEELVTGGVFALSRNPIYLGMDAIALGAALGTGALAFLLAALLLLPGVHRQIRREERFLAARHGAAFVRYRARVLRYLGRRRARDAARTGG